MVNLNRNNLQSVNPIRYRVFIKAMQIPVNPSNSRVLADITLAVKDSANDAEHVIEQINRMLWIDWSLVDNIMRTLKDLYEPMDNVFITVMKERI